MKFEVVTTQWSADGRLFGGGVHDDVKLTKKLASLVAAAEAAGSVRVLEASREERALLKGHVQSQADGEKAYAAAQASGGWVHGNLAQFVAAKADEIEFWIGERAKYAELPDHPNRAAAVAKIATAERQRDEAQVQLDAVEEPT